MTMELDTWRRTKASLVNGIVKTGKPMAKFLTIIELNKCIESLHKLKLIQIKCSGDWLRICWIHW